MRRRRRRRPRRTTTTCKTKHWRKSTELRDAYAVHSECPIYVVVSLLKIFVAQANAIYIYMFSQSFGEFNMAQCKCRYVFRTYDAWPNCSGFLHSFNDDNETWCFLFAFFAVVAAFDLEIVNSATNSPFSVRRCSIAHCTNWNDRIRSDRNWLIPKMLEPSVWDRISAAIPGWTPFSKPPRESSSTTTTNSQLSDTNATSPEHFLTRCSKCTAPVPSGVINGRKIVLHASIGKRLKNCSNCTTFEGNVKIKHFAAVGLLFVEKCQTLILIVNK